MYWPVFKRNNITYVAIGLITNIIRNYEALENMENLLLFTICFYSEQI